MQELSIARQLLSRLRAERPAGWWQILEPSIVRETGVAVTLDTTHPAYVEAAAKHGPLFRIKSSISPAAVAKTSTTATSASPSPARDPRSLLWLQLHRRPLEAQDLAKEAQWLAAFAARVPCGECRRHWKQLTTQTPPDFNAWSTAPDGKAAYARWTWTLHNAVNALINKPQFSWEDAVALHQWQAILPPEMAPTG